MPSRPVFGEETRDLLASVAWPRLRELANRVVVAVGLPESGDPLHDHFQGSRLGGWILQVAPSNLDVLLRHRLLRKPGGFEGFRWLRVLLDAENLAALDGDDVSQLHIDGNAAFCPVTREADPDVSPIAVDLNLKRLHPQVGVSLDPSPYLLPHRLDAPVNTGIGISGVVHVDGVAVVKVQGGELAGNPRLSAIESGVGTTDELFEILLRHRLLPQPGGFEPNRPCRLAPDDVVDLEDLRLAWLYPHIGQYRHQALAERLPLLPRVPDLANTDAAIHQEGDVVFQPIRGEVTAIPFQ